VIKGQSANMGPRNGAHQPPSPTRQDSHHTTKPLQKRKLEATAPVDGYPAATWSNLPPDARAARYEDYAYPLPDEHPQPQPKRARKVKLEKEPQEKRLRRFRANPPRDYHVVYQRATSQRFYVLGRSRCGTARCPEEFVELTGSTGNIYLVHIAQQPSCTCPHAKSGHQCKHVIYVLSRVLRARHDLVYQLALLSSELVEILYQAPPIEVGDDAEKPSNSNRKPVEGDCPICFCAFEAAEAIVYCRATCGQNIHKGCFEMWAATKRKSPGAKEQVTCPMYGSSYPLSLGFTVDTRF
jgi:hypothetical protein